MKRYVYFVSYAHSQGFGNLAEIPIAAELNRADVIAGLGPHIEAQKGLKGVVVLSFQLLRTEDA